MSSRYRSRIECGIDTNTLSLIVGGQQATPAPILAPNDRPSIPNTTTLQPFGPQATLGMGNGPTLPTNSGLGGGGVGGGTDMSLAPLM